MKPCLYKTNIKTISNRPTLNKSFVREMVESESDGEIKYQQLRHINVLISIPIHQATITFEGFLLILNRPWLPESH